LIGSTHSLHDKLIYSFSPPNWTVDLKHGKIRVNAISPGPIDTPIFSSAKQSEEQIEQIKTSLVASVPMGRIGSPDEVAKAVSFLASDDSNFLLVIKYYS
jgi:NAD(P)-dependent dehydrogenase (short-subunit alcohol dehydrogenase family)